MILKCMKRCSNSHRFREMQIKTTLGYISYLSDWRKLKSVTAHSVSEDEGSQTTSYATGGNENWSNSSGVEFGNI